MYCLLFTTYTGGEGRSERKTWISRARLSRPRPREFCVGHRGELVSSGRVASGIFGGNAGLERGKLVLDLVLVRDRDATTEHVADFLWGGERFPSASYVSRMSARQSSPLMGKKEPAVTQGAAQNSVDLGWGARRGCVCLLLLMLMLLYTHSPQSPAWPVVEHLAVE
ncbi:hypothetical protein LY76DRAFT_11758 [Colletotrichum caudatum]|nr:hypothetical protein LY76DRAFT_11758 [Colletotrichum caudatum]